MTIQGESLLLPLIFINNLPNTYGPNKPYQRENLFQSLTNYLTNAQNTIIGGDFNMVKDLNDRFGGSVTLT